MRSRDGRRSAEAGQGAMDGPHPLDNPMWQALGTRQRAFATGHGNACRYAPQVAPFAAVRDPGVRADGDLAAIVAVGECVTVVGVAPALSPAWRVLDRGVVIQMWFPGGPPPVPADARWEELGASDTPAMLALTALVYPEYFRERTSELGRYIGIREGGRLAAMAGERLATDSGIEISAVCTHPDFTGRGHAALLLAILARDISARGTLPFLHVGEHNGRAIALYQRMGFRERARLGLWKLRRER